MVRAKIPNRLKSFQSSTGSNSTGGASASLGDGSLSAPGSRSSSPAPAGRTGGAQVSPTLMLRTNVIKARNLAAKDKGGSSDPYLVLTLGDARQTTVSIPKSLNPEWNEIIELPVAGLNTMLLEVVCWDKDRFGKDYMGEFDIALEDVFASGSISQEPTWYRLESRKTGRKKSVVTGEVLLAFELYDPLHSSATPQQLHQKLVGIAANTPDFDEDDSLKLSRTDSGEQATDEEDDEEDESSPPDISDGTEDVNHRRETPEKRKRRLKLARMKRKAKQRAYEFTGMSDMAGVLFLEISRITDLPPERNVTRTSFDMDPFVVTSLGKKTYKTRVIRHNLNPVFDEKLVFQVMRHETNFALSFSIVDRDKLSGNDFVGTTSLPLEKISDVSPEPDAETGLYPLRSFEPSGHPGEGKRSRFRLPLSRSTSATNMPKLNNSRPAFSEQPSYSNGTPRLEPGLNVALSAPTPPEHVASATSAPSVISTESSCPEDPDLKMFTLPVNLKNKDRWEDRHKPTLYVKAKYLPYKALRQQFWRAMLRQYDADDSGFLSKVELTTMLDTLGSTLHETTIDKLFEMAQTEEQGEPALSIDQAVMCLEDLLQRMEEDRKQWFRRRAARVAEAARSSPRNPRSPQTEPASTSEQEGLSTSSSQELIKTAAPESMPLVLEPEQSGSLDEDGDENGEDDLADERNEEHIVEIRECPICHLPRLSKKSDADIITHVATCASQDWRQVNNIVMAGFVTSNQAQRKWYTKVINKMSYGGYRLGANSANILVQDRMTGQISEERMSVYVRLGIRLLYKGLKSREMEKKRIRKLLRSLSFKQGRKFDDPASAAEIQGFINFHQLDMSEVLLPTNQFKNFNEFFYRKLKPEARPCSAPDRAEIVTSPADCRTVVFNKLEEAQKIWVKGREFTVERLLGDTYPEDAKRYTNGALGIFRLAPQDYHRFHIPVDGVMGEPKPIEGEYYTVNPMAIRSALDVYGENIRVIVPIDSERHGRVMVVCVGAMMVGSTIITRQPGERVARAEELGYFKFGGSTLLLLFEPGMLTFDTDLADNSSSALETLVRVGMAIGHSPDAHEHTPDQPMNRADITHQDRVDARRRIEGSMAASSGELLGRKMHRMADGLSTH